MAAADPALSAADSIPLSLLARRPAVSAAAVLILGIAAHGAVADWPGVYLGMAAVFALVSLGCWRLPGVGTGLLVAAVFFMGVAAGQLEHFHFGREHIAGYTGEAARLAEVEVVIDQPPRILTSQTPGGRPLPPRQVTAGVVRRVKTWAGWREASGQILVQITPPNPGLRFGDRVTVLGMLGRPAPAMNPGEFDWARYYREQRTLASMEVSEGANVRPVAAGGLTWVQFLRKHARNALAKGFSEKQSLDHALLRALLLGDSDPQLRDVQADFVRTGTSHHLSISGMHVAVLGGVVFLFCRLLRLSPRWSATIMMAFVVLYGLVALPAPPVVRSIILCLTFGVAVLMRRSVDGVQLLAVTVFLMLLWNPLDLYNAGFQLSFGTVLGLMLYATRLNRWMDRRDEDDRVLASLGIAPTRARSIRNWLRGHLIEGVATGLVAWAVSAPLIVEHFDQLNPFAIPAGMLLALPVFAAMIAGLGKIVLTLVLPAFCAPALAWLASLPVDLMRLGVSWLAKVPGSDVALPAVPVVVVLLYYALLALPLLPTARTRVRWLFRGGAATACLTALMLPLLIGFAPRGGSGELKVTLLYVGAGQCAVVRTPGGRTILIDAGSSTITDLARRTIEPFLRHEGSRRVDAIYVSHANFDHFSAVSAAAETLGVGEVVVTPQFAGHARKNYPARQMLRRLTELRCPVHTASAGQHVDLGEGCALDVLWPPADEGLDANNSCQVMRLTFAGRSILFTGDIQGPAESALVSGAAALTSDVLIAPHHGSAEETTAPFLDAVHAQTILASNDRTPTGKQRKFDEITEGQRVLRTHETGAITVRVTREGKLRVDTFLNPR